MRRRLRPAGEPEAASRDVALVLSGGGVNGVLMELGFLQRVRESELWPRIGWIYGTSSGALAATMAALDRLEDLEEFLVSLQPEETFRPHRLWQLPLVVLATDVTGDEDPAGRKLLELAYSSRTTPPGEFAQAVVASAAISALVLPLRVGDRIATDGGWVRNFPLGYAYSKAAVETIVAFRYLPRYPRMGAAPIEYLRRRLERFGRVPPIRALVGELREAEARAERGEPAHLVEMIARLMRVSILRNSVLEERIADATDESIRELESLRRDVIALAGRRSKLARAIDERFADAQFPFRHERRVPRITVHASVDEIRLEPGFRTQKPWSEDEKRALIRRGYDLTDAQLTQAEAAAS